VSHLLVTGLCHWCPHHLGGRSSRTGEGFLSFCSFSTKAQVPTTQEAVHQATKAAIHSTTILKAYMYILFAGNSCNVL